MENARQDFAVHVFRHRNAKEIKKRWSEIDEPCIFNLGSSFQCWPTADQDPIKAVCTAPFAIFGWTMLANHHGRLLLILSKTWLRRKEAVFAPPVEDEIGGFVGKRAMEDLVTSINARDYRV